MDRIYCISTINISTYLYIYIHNISTVYIYIYLYTIHTYTPYVHIYVYIYIRMYDFPVLVFGSQSVNLLVHFFTPPCHLRLMKLKLPGQVAVLAASDIVGQSPFACLLLRETE